VVMLAALHLQVSRREQVVALLHLRDFHRERVMALHLRVFRRALVAVLLRRRQVLPLELVMVLLHLLQ
jgi:hypothetical protein